MSMMNSESAIFLRDPVKYAARHRYRRVLRSPLSIAIDEIVALLPFLDEFRDQLGRILAVGIDNDVSVALKIGETTEQRRLIAEIARMRDQLNAAILRTKLPDELRTSGRWRRCR